MSVMTDAALIAKVLNVPSAVVVMPTDTVYGLAARAADQEAVKRLYALKQRRDKPGTLIGHDIEQLSGLGLARRYLKAVEQYWPGAVSVIIPLGNSELGYLSQGLPSLAVRVPKDSFVESVLAQTGPLMTTSANPPGLPPAINIAAARKYFGSEVDAYFDGGDLSDREPSTIIRIIDDAVEVIRQGAVRLDGV
jgi:L-threonylcarbamoyladenylate synthase